MVDREPLVVLPGIVLPEDEVRAEFARSGGPGGQNVNKVETKVVLRFDVARSRAFTAEQRARALRRLASRLTTRGELLVVATEHRSRARNLDEARERLVALLRTALVVEKTRRPTRPTRGSVRRRLDTKRKRSGTKQARRGGEDT